MSLYLFAALEVLIMALTVGAAYFVSAWAFKIRGSAQIARSQADLREKIDQQLRENQNHMDRITRKAASMMAQGPSGFLPAHKQAVYPELYHKLYRAYRASVAVVRNIAPISSLAHNGYIEETLRSVGASKKDVARITGRDRSLAGDQSIIHELNAAYFDHLHHQCQRDYTAAMEFFEGCQLYVPQSVIEAVESLDSLLHPIVLKMPGQQAALQESQLTTQITLIRHLLLAALSPES